MRFRPADCLKSTALAAAVALAASSANAMQTSLCPDGDIVHYEADAADGSRRIAVCSTPGSADTIGAISVYSGTKTSNGFAGTLMVQANGAERRKTFVLRRYTRPQTTYLKFEFTARDGQRISIYDDFDNGETGTRVAWKEQTGDTGVEPSDFVSVSEPLMLMALEPVVSVQPYDE